MSCHRNNNIMCTGTRPDCCVYVYCAKVNKTAIKATPLSVCGFIKFTTTANSIVILLHIQRQAVSS